MSKNPPFRNGEENEKVIWNPHAGLDHHQKLIISRKSPLAHACQVWSMSVSVFISYPDRHWSVSLWRDPDDVSHCRILPLTKLNGGLSRLHSADEVAVSWLTNYGKWHAYEKKKLSCLQNDRQNDHISSAWLADVIMLLLDKLLM